MAVTGFPVAFVPANFGGTTIAQWQPGADHYLRSTLYGHMAYRARSSGAGMVLWWLGETDANLGTAQATFNSGFDTMCNAVNSDLGIKVMACKLQNCSTPPAANLQKINDAYGDAWGDNANALLGPVLTGIDTDDGFHLLTDAKLLAAAQLWAAKILAVL